MKWRNKNDDYIVKVTETIEYIIHPLKKDIEFTNTFKLNALKGIISASTTSVSMVNIQTGEKLSLKEQDIDINTEDIQTVISTTLPEKRKYKFTRITEKILDIREDPTIRVRSRYVYNPDVTINSDNTDLIFAFESAGVSPKFEDIATGSKKPKNRHRRLHFPSLMLPHQGYIITIMKC